jgi:DNA repair protein RadC
MLDASIDSFPCSDSTSPGLMGPSDPAPPAHLMPRERLWQHGTSRMSDEDLVAILLGTGTRGRPVWSVARDVVRGAGGLPALSRAAPQELIHTAGIGSCRAMRMVAAFEVGRRAMFEQPQMKRMISPEDIVRLLTPRLAGITQECCFVIGIDSRNNLIAEVEVARGSLMMVAVQPREVFRPLIRMSAAAAILAHNHPSGDPTPSFEDLEMTSRLRDVGDMVGIPLVDHIVMGKSRYCSINDWVGTLL